MTFSVVKIVTVAGHGINKLEKQVYNNYETKHKLSKKLQYINIIEFLSHYDLRQ